MTAESERVPLASGGYVEVTVDVPWLRLSDADLRFVQGIIGYLRAAAPASPSNNGAGAAPDDRDDDDGWEPYDDRADLAEARAIAVLGGRGAPVLDEVHLPGIDDPVDLGDAPTGPHLVLGAAPAWLTAPAPEGFPCPRCDRVLATVRGRSRHITVAHTRRDLAEAQAEANGITEAQAEARRALLAGDRYGVDHDGLVRCGYEGCAARRLPGDIERHRNAMHGVG